MSVPPKPQKPGLVKVFKALYKYEATQPDELSFQEGDILYIPASEMTPSDGDAWWKATCRGVSGLIPSNYVDVSSGAADAIEAPLHEASKRGQLDFLRECLQHRIPINGLDKSGSTPLYWSAHGGHEDCIKEMMKYGSKVQLDIQNKMGDTALHAASWKGHAKIVQMLLSAGANPQIRNNDKKLPGDLARTPDVGALFVKRNHAEDEEYLVDSDEDENESLPDA